MRRFVSFAMLILIFATPMFAQTTAGSIVGVIVDLSGAAVSGADVTVTNLDTAQVFKTISDSSGNYVATPLVVGRYFVVVEAPGFKKAVSTNIKVNVQSSVELMPAWR